MVHFVIIVGAGVEIVTVVVIRSIVAIIVVHVVITVLYGYGNSCVCCIGHIYCCNCRRYVTI